MSKFYFKVEVREGGRGFADDSEHVSKPYKTFADAYRALYYFVPNRHWRYLRYISRMEIWLDGHPSVDVCTYGGYAIEIKDLTKLHITEEEFDRIIAKINKQQDELTTSDGEEFDRIIGKLHKTKKIHR